MGSGRCIRDRQFVHRQVGERWTDVHDQSRVKPLGCDDINLFAGGCGRRLRIELVGRTRVELFGDEPTLAFGIDETRRQDPPNLVPLPTYYLPPLHLSLPPQLFHILHSSAGSVVFKRQLINRMSVMETNVAPIFRFASFKFIYKTTNMTFKLFFNFLFVLDSDCS